MSGTLGAARTGAGDAAKVELGAGDELPKPSRGFGHQVALALAVLGVLAADDLIGRADVLGKTLHHGIESLGHPLVDHVRGRGLLRGVVLSSEAAKPVEVAARDAGFLVNAAAPDVIRLAPPLVLRSSCCTAGRTTSTAMSTWPRCWRRQDTG